MKHVVQNVSNMKNDKKYYGMEEEHFGCRWRIFFSHSKTENLLDGYLECKPVRSNKNWSIESDIEKKWLTKAGEKSFLSYYTFSGHSVILWAHLANRLDENLLNDSFTIETYVKITKMTGIVTEIKRSFDDESAKEFSDVVLIVNDRKFHVMKMYLASHSSYFKSLFYANFNESGKSEIELNDIFPSEFQNFLELIHGESVVDDDTVIGILKLADMYDSTTAIRRCEEYLVNKSNQPLKKMFDIAIKYKMEKLKKKCLSNLTSTSDVWSIVPKDANELDPSTWKELLRLTISLK